MKFVKTKCFKNLIPLFYTVGIVVYFIGVVAFLNAVIGWVKS